MADGPDNKPTAQLDQTEILSGLLKKLDAKIDDGFAHVHRRLDHIEGSVDLANGQVKTLAAQVNLIDSRLHAVEQRQDQQSIRVKGQSEVDAQHEAQLAQEQAERKALAEEVQAIKEKTAAIEGKQDTAIVLINELKKSPIAQKIVMALGALILALLGLGLVAVQNLTTEIKHRPTTHTLPEVTP